MGKRVLFLTTEVGGVGGVQYAGRLILRALEDWCQPGGQVSMVTINDTRKDLEPYVAECQAFGGGRSRISTGLKALALLKYDRWDLIVLGHLNLAPLVLRLARRRRPPCLSFIHGLEGWRPLRRLRRWGLSQFDRLLYISRHTQSRSWAANSWLADIESEVCPLGLLPEEDKHAGGANGNGRLNGKMGEKGTSFFSPPFSPRPGDLRRLGEKKDVPFSPNGEKKDVPFSPGGYALIIGRMPGSESYKGHEELIGVWPAVMERRPDFPLLIIGDGGDRPRLEELAGRSAAAVRFLGQVDDATRDGLLAHCRCFCMPSRGEGLGLVYLEAMRAGRPVLAGATDAGAEVVVDGVTGRAVDPKNPTELLQGILDVSGDRAAAMGKAGQTRFEEQFCYERFLERFSAHLEAVTTKAKKAKKGDASLFAPTY